MILLTAFHAQAMDDDKILCQIKLPSVSSHYDLREGFRDNPLFRLFNETYGSRLAFSINASDVPEVTTILESMDIIVTQGRVSAAIRDRDDLVCATPTAAVKTVYQELNRLKGLQCAVA